MIEFFRGLFESDGFVPHGTGMLWDPRVVWLHAASNIAIALAYFSIPVALVLFVRRRRDLAFQGVFLLFGAFIFWCGATHLVEAWTLWHPIYRFEGLVKAVTALLSVAAAVTVWARMPRALALPDMVALRTSNSQLAREIADHRSLQADLQRRRTELEAIIEERTSALRKINQELLRENAERRQAQKDLAEAKEAAEQASRAKTQFLANMSHELRTPLNAIIGFSEVLEDHTFGPLNERQGRYVRNILTSGRDLLQLINDVLDLSKIEAGRMDLELEPFSAREALFDIQKVVRALAAKKQIDLSVETPESMPLITADQAKFKQIMYNLLSNAVKFTPDHGSVRVVANVVTESGLDTQAHDVACPYLRVSVVDTGIGIPPESFDRVFEEFEQLDSSFQRMHEGSGLGLALTRKLVRMHGGRIWLHSEGIGRGSTFTFALPLSATPEAFDAEVSAAATAPEEEVRDPEDPLVLVVEDDPHARELLRHHLCTAGYRVTFARDGAEALRIAPVAKPIAITLDVLLPQKDGWEVLRELKSSPETESIPVIVVSVTKDSRLGYSLGAVDYLVKPVDRERLLAALRRAAGSSGKEPMTVLIVDDEPASVEILSSTLRSEGLHVLAAYGGRHGIELAQRHMPDAIVLDLNMPDVTGFDVIQSLREKPETKWIPVLVFTAMDLTKEEQHRLNEQIRALVPKSAREDLLQALAELRRKRGQPDALSRRQSAEPVYEANHMRKGGT